MLRSAGDMLGLRRTRDVLVELSSSQLKGIWELKKKIWARNMNIQVMVQMQSRGELAQVTVECEKSTGLRNTGKSNIQRSEEWMSKRRGQWKHQSYEEIPEHVVQ